MDHVTFTPERLVLADHVFTAADLSPFSRDDLGRQVGRQPSYLRLSLKCNHRALLVLIAHPLTDGRWKITRIAANLPALRWGHNGRPLRTSVDLAVALTRLRHFTRRVTAPSGHACIVPGVGRVNHSFVRTVELMVQIVDPGHRFLLASHQAAIRFQHRAPMVTWGESTRFSQDEIGISVYDKIAQLKKAQTRPKGVEQTRLEYVVKDPSRLAQDVGDALDIPGGDNTVVSTLALKDAYKVCRFHVARLLRFPESSDLNEADLSKTARLLLVGLGDRIDDPHAINCLLEDYQVDIQPSERTFRTIDAEVRGAAIQRLVPRLDQVLPADFDALKWADAVMVGTEKDFDAFIDEWRAPNEPDPEILAAWSATRFLKAKPSAVDLTGSVSLGISPFLKRHTF